MVTEYENLKKIETICNLLDGDESREAYRVWLTDSAPELRAVLEGSEVDGFESVRRGSDSYLEARAAILEYLRKVMNQRRDEWSAGTYALSENAFEDYNFKRFAHSWSTNQDRLLVFLGAGASIGARNLADRPLPSATELRDLIARRFLPPDSDTTMALEQVSARAEAYADRSSLAEFVENLFVEAKPLWQHAALPFLRPRAVYTTNYDDLIERGWALHKDNDKVDPSKAIYEPIRGPGDRKMHIFKPHGSVGFASSDVGQGGLVLTQFDYFEMLSNNEKMLEQFFSEIENYCVLFVGYSLSDMDIGPLLWAKRENKSSVSWYAVFPCDETTRKMYADKFKVDVINHKFHQFIKELDEKIDIIPPEWKFDQIENLRNRELIG